MIKLDMVWPVHSILEVITTCTMIKKKIIGIRKVKKVRQKIIHNVKRDKNLGLKMEPYIRVNGKVM